MDEAALQYVEDVGTIFEKTGLPRIAGRIMGSLLIADPPYRSAEELADHLKASKSSISTMTRVLEQFGFIQRFSMPGVRQRYFRLNTDLWERAIRNGFDEVRNFRALAERGLKLMEEKPAESRKWLEDMRDIYGFLEDEFPAILLKWEKRKASGQQQAA